MKFSEYLDEKHEEGHEDDKKDDKKKTTVGSVIKELIETSWSGDNESQMKAVQLLKGVALSDEAEANEFMKKLDKFTSGLK